MSNKCSLKIYSGKNMLHGTAAILHKISTEGGWDDYHSKLIGKITSKVTREVLDELNRPVLRKVK
jgi:hypothetical protein